MLSQSNNGAKATAAESDVTVSLHSTLDTSETSGLPSFNGQNHFFLVDENSTEEEESDPRNVSMWVVVPEENEDFNEENSITTSGAWQKQHSEPVG